MSCVFEFRPYKIQFFLLSPIRICYSLLLSFLLSQNYLQLIFPLTVLSISTDDQRKASTNLLKEVGYYFPEIEVIKGRFLSNLADKVSYSAQTRCLFQILLNPCSQL